MSKTTKIPNRTATCLSINRELLAKAKEQGLNISIVLDAALEKELNSYSQEAFMRAMERQNDGFKKFIQDSKLEDTYESWKYGKGVKADVVQEEKGSGESKIAENLRFI